MSEYTIHNGDCLEVLKTLEANSVDACVTDPPYELGFMGKSWDSTGIAYNVDLWREVFRVLKPGAHLLAFGGSRTYHRMACAIEDAGFEIRDQIQWIYGCLSDDTEILTSDGWKRNHKDILSHRVLCYNVDKDGFEFHSPTQHFSYANEHTAYRIESDSTDQIVSRNHRVLVERGGRKEFICAEALEREANIPFLESLSDLPESIYDFHERASHSKQVLLDTVLRQEIEIAKETSGHAFAHAPVPDLRKGISGKARQIIKLLQSQMQRIGSRRGMETTRPQGTQGVESGIGAGTDRAYDRRYKPSVERRRNLYAKKGLLLQRCVDKIRSMSERIYLNGTERRLCYGTSSFSGSGFGSMFDAGRNRASRRPRSHEQRPQQSGTIRIEPRSQAVRSSRATASTLARVTPIEYKGNVWCVEVPTGAFVARRNGKIFITGNSGFPKSLDVSKAIDKVGGRPDLVIEIGKAIKDARESRNMTVSECDRIFCGGTTNWSWYEGRPRGQRCPTADTFKQIVSAWPELKHLSESVVEVEREIIGAKSGSLLAVAPGQLNDRSRTELSITVGTSINAKTWSGFGTALKPAFEPLVVGRKPLVNIDEFAIMVREVIANLCQSKSLAEIAKKSFQSNLPEQNVGLNIAQWIAEKSINTPGVLFGLMAMCRSEWEPGSSLNTVLLWLDTLAAICSGLNTFTIETKSSLIIELKILNSLPLPIILERIIRGETMPNGDDTSVYTADNIFNAVSLKLKYILEHSAPETAISKVGQTGLRPDHEPICMARKPLEKGLTVAQNVLKWGTGAINIDKCRVEGITDSNPKIRNATFSGFDKSPQTQIDLDRIKDNGRFPANVIHDGSDEVLAGFPETTSGKVTSDKDAYGNGSMFLNGVSNQNNQHGDSGSASRFFYSPKASKYDRDQGCGELDDKTLAYSNQAQAETARGNTHKGKSGINTTKERKNHHPTVKPTDLMQYLCRLVTPPGGLILDPFLGSGSTAKAALIERFKVIGIELEPEYVKIAEARCKQLQVKLF